VTSSGAEPATIMLVAKRLNDNAKFDLDYSAFIIKLWVFFSFFFSSFDFTHTEYDVFATIPSDVFTYLRWYAHCRLKTTALGYVTLKRCKIITPPLE
jgi:hypothetical protein